MIVRMGASIFFKLENESLFLKELLFFDLTDACSYTYPSRVVAGEGKKSAWVANKEVYDGRTAVWERSYGETFSFFNTL